MSAGGAVAIWSLAAKAQGKRPVIGYLHFATADYQPAAASFLWELAETGFTEARISRLRIAGLKVITIACRRWLPSWLDSRWT